MAEMIAQGETAADIGTDHGYVPMLLVKEGKSPAVIMSDISEGSLAKAKDTFRLCGIDIPEEDFRVGDGLETIGYSEVDAVIIGGLGGHTIAGILDADIEKSRSFSKLVLQPRKHSGTLRHYLFTHGWDITREELAPEGKFECEIICAVPSGTGTRPEPHPQDDIRWKYPAALVEADRVLARKRIEWKLGSIEEQIHNMKKSGSSEERIAVLINDREYLRDLIRE